MQFVMSEENVRERIQTALKINNLSVLRLADGIGSVQTRLNKQINKTTTISVDTILILLDKLPELSAEWLLRGQGSISRTSTPTNSVSVDSISGDNAVVGNNVNIATVKNYEQTIQELNAQIAELKKDKENLNRLVDMLSQKQ